MERRKIVPGLLIVLALMASTLVAVPLMAQVIFTGDAESDFLDTDVDVWICPDGEIVWVPMPPPAERSGWDIKDLRLRYDAPSDILYIGVNSYETVGDADSDGYEGSATYGGGTDQPNLGGQECVSVYFDLDQNGSYDVIAGVPINGDFSTFSVNYYGASPQLFGAPIAGHLGTVYWNPPTDPDLEFQIEDFGDLPNQDSELGEFDVGVFMGSFDDGAIGEDQLVCSVNLTTPPPPVGGAAFPVNKLGLLAPWAIVLGCAGLVAILMLRRRKQA